MSESQNYDNIVNIDGSSHYRGKKIRKPSKKKSSRIRPEHIAAFIFIVISVYIAVNLYIYHNKEEVSIYEVQGQSLSRDSSYTGIAVRDETLVSCSHAGYISYFVANGRRAAKRSIICTIDAGSTVYSSLKNGFEDFSLDSDDITSVKKLIASYMDMYDSSDTEWIPEFESRLTDMVYDIVNENMLEELDDISSSSTSNSDLYRLRASESGVVSYRADSLTGITADSVDASMFSDDYELDSYSLRSTGLVGAGDTVYRLCSSEDWSIVILVDEDFYIDNLETESADIRINSSVESISASVRTFQSGDSYFVELGLNDYMSQYMDDRFLTVEFESDEEEGLKIPLSAIDTKGFYLVPLDCFCNEEGYSGQVLKAEVYDETGTVTYECIYPSTYYSDGYYAYIDTDLLENGQVLVNPNNGERCKVALINYLEGVYNVNKGYYQFVRIERIRQNNEYVIIRSDTAGGIRQYDHIALNASDAVEQQIIY